LRSASPSGIRALEGATEVAKSDRNRQQALRSFVDLCHRVGFELEPFQVKIAGALLGPQRETLTLLPRQRPRIGSVAFIESR
jgi:hypothetical protein